MCGYTPTRPLRYGTSETGHHGDRRGKRRVQLAADRLTEGDAVAGTRPRCERPVFPAGRRAGEQLPPARDVVREAARREDGAMPGPDRHLAIRRRYHRTRHRGVAGGQPDRLRRHPQLHAQVVGGFHQPRDQRRAVDQVHALPVPDEVERVPADPPAGVPERRRGTGGVHELVQVRPGHDAHTQQGGLVQLTAQFAP